MRRAGRRVSVCVHTRLRGRPLASFLVAVVLHPQPEDRPLDEVRGKCGVGVDEPCAEGFRGSGACVVYHLDLYLAG